MSVYAISDTHLSTVMPKPMDIFGSNWTDHWARISGDWKQKVSEADTVLIAGDISWAMSEKDAKTDAEKVTAIYNYIDGH